MAGRAAFLLHPSSQPRSSMHLQDIKLTLTKSVCKSSNSFTPFHLLQVHNSIFPESPESPPLAWKIIQHSFKCQNATPPLISLPYPMQPRTPLRAGSPLHACKNLINRSLKEREWGDQKGELSGPNRAQQEEDRLRFPPARQGLCQGKAADSWSPRPFPLPVSLL